MSSSRSNISIKALIAFSTEIFVYMDCTSKLINRSDPSNTVKNSYEFSQRIKNIGLVWLELLMRFNVQPMYTNISGKKAISAIMEILQRKEDILEADGVAFCVVAASFPCIEVV
ncbi:unnamed protein product [Protopolystoma xenopodis]|uniref:Uncharacterized protein n=1 Tax=Protopolystoma xenopodis TaxID=117903 RepID=A0A448WUS8_9PLAT|nr:unnamed protein product [Protopolystoma xenopodis]